MDCCPSPPNYLDTVLHLVEHFSASLKLKKDAPAIRLRLKRFPSKDFCHDSPTNRYPRAHLDLILGKFGELRQCYIEKEEISKE